MYTNDEAARKVNSPPYVAVVCSENAQNVGFLSTCPQVPTSVRGCRACGLRRARVSGRRSATSASVPTPYAATASSAARQPSHWLSKPPSGAHTQATMPSPVSAFDMARAPSCGV